MTSPPPTPTIAELVAAPLSLLLGTALRTDRYHPRILLRMPACLLTAMLRIFVLCEILGEWPSAIDGILIALLPKASGGLRPIGIFPTFVRVWFQLRAP